VDAADDIIYRSDSEGRTVGPLGTNPEPWTWLTHVIERAARGKARFYLETDIGWSKDGSMFVADGYGISRVVKFDAFLRHRERRPLQARWLRSTAARSVARTSARIALRVYAARLTAAHLLRAASAMRCRAAALSLRRLRAVGATAAAATPRRLPSSWLRSSSMRAVRRVR